MTNQNYFHCFPFLFSYWVFRSWGRISTSIGSDKLIKFRNLEEAREHFNEQYQEKTGNLFGASKLINKYFFHIFSFYFSFFLNNINSQLLFNFRFEKHPGRYYKLDIDYGEESEVRKLTENKIESKLEKPVQEVRKKFSSLF